MVLDEEKNIHNLVDINLFKIINELIIRIFIIEIMVLILIKNSYAYD